ncbi:hypothetical protein GCM10008083_21380 [Ulvibacter litoralis]|nr:hypothetical protein GCM10008083_21380 [Ulvibacter litoralis]
MLETENSMMQNFYDIVKGKFLVNDDALKNWRFIIFLSLLALVMIASSHAADKKVHQISKLSNDVKELKSEYVDVRMRLMQSRMESKVIKAMASRGIVPSETPPQKIKIITKE